MTITSLFQMEYLILSKFHVLDPIPNTNSLWYIVTQKCYNWYFCSLRKNEECLDKTMTVFVFSGVLQGSHCESLLVNLSVDDIQKVISNSKFLLFVDDVKLNRKIGVLRIMIFYIKNNVYEWSIINGLNLNVKKCLCPLVMCGI